MTQFFSRMGDSAAEGALIHAKVHESGQRDISIKDLTLWLVEQIRKEQEEIQKARDAQR